MNQHFLRILPALPALLLCVGMASAQTLDLGLNVTGLIARNPQVSAEYALGKRFGLELSLGTALGQEKVTISDGTTSQDIFWRRSGFLAGLQGKYYTSPDDVIDGFYLAPYLRYRRVNFKPEGGTPDTNGGTLHNNRLAVGLALGYKAVLSERFIIEVAAGAGAAPLSDNEFLNAFEGDLDFFDKLDNLDLYARLSAGYRLRL